MISPSVPSTFSKQVAFETQLQSLVPSKKRWLKGWLIVQLKEDKLVLERTYNLFKVLGERLAGYVGGKNLTNRLLVEVAVIHFLATNKEQVRPGDVEGVRHLAKEVSADSGTMSAHEELSAVVSEVCTPHFRQAELTSPIEHFKKKHHKELAVFAVIMEKLQDMAQPAPLPSVSHLPKETSTQETATKDLALKSFSPEKEPSLEAESAPAKPISLRLPLPVSISILEEHPVQPLQPESSLTEAIKPTKLKSKEKNGYFPGWKTMIKAAGVALLAFAGGYALLQREQPVIQEPSKIQGSSNFTDPMLTSQPLSSSLCTRSVCWRNPQSVLEAQVASTILSQPSPVIKTRLSQYTANCLDATLPSSSSRCIVEQAELHQTQTFLEQEPLPVTDSDLVHLTDFFGKDTGLEGSASTASFVFMQKMLKQLISSMPETALKATCPAPLPGFETMVVGAAPPVSAEEAMLIDYNREVSKEFLATLLQKIDLGLQIAQASQQDVETLSRVLGGALRRLKPGELLFFPGGWAGNPSGHALVYEFEAQEHHQFTFRIYNTGSGLEYHTQETHGHKIRVLTITEWNDVSVETAVRPEYWKSMQELGKLPDPSEKPWNSHDVYSKWAPALHGTPSVREVPEDALQSPQRSATCGFQSLLSAMREKFSSKAASGRVHWQILLKSIQDYAHHNQDRFPRELTRNLFRKSLEEVARITNNRFDEGSINSLERAFGENHLKQFQELLDGYESTHLAGFAKDAPLVSLSPLPQSSDAFGRLESIEKPFTPATVPPRQPTPYHPIQLEVSLDPNTLVQQMKVLGDQIQDVISKNDPRTALRHFQDLMEKLPFVADQHDSLWNQCSYEDKIETVSQLSKLGKLAYQACLKDVRLRPSHDKTVEPRTLVALVKAQTLAMQLVKSIDPDLPKKIFLTDALEGIFKESNMLYFCTYDPSLDEIIKKSREMMEKADDDDRNFHSYWHFANFAWKDINFPSEGRTSSNIPDSDRFLKWLKKYEENFLNECQGIERKIPGFSSLSRLQLLPMAILDRLQVRGSYVPVPRVLPSYFYALRDLKHSIAALKELPLTFDNSYADKPQDFIFVGSVPENSISGSHEVSMKRHVISTTTPEKQTAAYSNSEMEMAQIAKWIHIQNAHRQVSDENLKLPLIRNTGYPSEMRFVRADEETYVTENSSGGLDLQTERAFKGLVSKKELQVKETLKYFKENPDLLADPEYQTLFKLLVFEPGLLLNQLEGSIEADARHLIAELANFASSNYRDLRDRGNLETASFFLHLNELFSRYNAHVRPDAPASFMDTRHEIREVLKRKELSSDARALFNQELALCYRGRRPLSKTELVELVHAGFSTQLLGSGSQYAARENTLAIEQLINDWLPSIQALYSGKDKDDLLNSLVGVLTGTSPQAAWTPVPDFSIFVASDGSRINLREMSLDIQSGLVVSTPKELFEHPLIITMFPEGMPKIVTRIGLEQYQFETPQGKYRTMQSAKGLIVQKRFERLENGRVLEDWRQFISHEAIGDGFKLTGIVKDHIHWVSSLRPNEITVTLPAEHTSLYQIEYSEPGLLSWILQRKPEMAIVRIHGNADEQGLIAYDGPFYDKQVSKWDFLQRFEDPGYIFLWNHPSTQLPHLLELPRFGIQFKAETIKGKQQFVSANFPGFHLAEKQYVPALKDFRHFLLLENTKGEQKVLIPNQKFEKEVDEKGEKTSSLEPSRSHPDRSLNTPSITKQTALVYSIDQAGQLIPETDEGRIHLSMVYLWKMDYANALRYLKGTGSSLRLLTTQEQQALTNLIDLNKANGDQDPRSTAIRLHAVLLLIKDKQMRAREGEEMGLPNFTSIYSEYLNQLSNIPQGKLAIDEELVILNAISGKREPMLNRLKALAPLKGKTSLAYLSTAASEEFLHTRYQQQLSRKAASISIKVPIGDPPKLFTLSSLGNFLRSDSKSKTPSILRPSTLTHLNEGYCLAKGEAAGQAGLYYEKLTGLTTYDPEGFKIALEMMLAGAETNEEKMALHLFDALLSHPERFPNTQQFLKDLSDFRRNEKALIRDKEWDRSVESLRKTIFEPLQEIVNQKYQEKLKVWEAQAKREADRLQPSPSEEEQQDRGTIVQEFVPLSHQFSVPSPSVNETGHPLLNNIGLAGIQAVPVASMADKGESQKGLQALFQDLSNLDPVTQKEFKKTAASVALYQEAERLEKMSYQLDDPAKLRQFADVLEHSLAAEKTTQTDMETSLLKQANKVPERKLARVKHWLERLGGSGTLLTMDDLVELFWRQDAALFHIHNPALSPDNIIQLQRSIVDYLQHATRVQHMDRLAEKLAEIKTGQDNKMVKEERDELVAQAADLMTDQRHYDSSEHPEYLVIEYKQKIRLRKQQVDKLDLLDIQKGRILHPESLGVAGEMIMGGGKSSVLLPELLSLFADGEHIAIGVVPEGLLPTVAKDLSRFFGKALKRSVQVLSFTGKTVINEETLRDIAAQLKSAREMRNVLLTASGSIESFYLKAIKHLHTAAHASQVDPELFAQFLRELDLVREILTLFRTQGRVIVDEGDLIFNPRRERHFTFGMEKPFDSHEGELIGFLYESLLIDPAIQNVMTFDFAPGKNDRPFNRDTYQKEVVPRLIELLLQNNLGSTREEVTTFFKALTQEDRGILAAYLNHDKTASVLNAVRDFPPKVRDLLALGKEEIHVLLPLTCNKQQGINYGTIPGKNIPVHFHGSNKPTQSDFEFYEAPSYTFQTFAKHGIPVDFFSNQIILLRTQALRELREDKSLKLEDTQAGQAFRTLCGEDCRFSLFSVKPEELAATINQDMRKKLKLIRTVILPEITFKPLSLSANPQIFNFLFESVTAFTGTPWNADTYPQRLRIESDNTVSGITHGILWKNSQNKVYTITAPSQEKFAQELIGNHPHLHHVNAFIDIAGMSRGISNEAVARQFLDLPEFQKRNINGVVFYNAEDELMILERGKGRAPPAIKPLAAASTPLEERFTFYDQPHTTGADIKQLPDAVGLATIGKQTLQRDALQGEWRFRELAKLQRIEFVLDKETEAVIRDKLKELTGKPLEGKIELKHLLLFTTYNQALLQGDNNYRALRHKMKALLQAEAFSILLDPRVDAQCVLEFFKEVEELFVDKNIPSPWDLFGLPQEPQASTDVVKADMEKWLNSSAFQALQSPIAITQTGPQASLKAKLETLVTSSHDILPAVISKASQAYGREVEKETETEKEAEKEKETEKEVEQQIEKTFDVEKQHPRQRIDLGGALFIVDHISFSEKSPNDACPILPLSYSLNLYDDLKLYQDVFDSRLLSTNNLTPVFYYDSSTQPYHIFGFDQKSVTDLLFIKMPDGLRAIMLDLGDSAECQSRLQQEDSKINTSIYSFQLGLHAQGKCPISPQELQDDPHFMRLIVQAKFFNGEVYYTAEEMKVLEAWIKEKGAARMYTLFHDHILASPAKSSSRKAFSSSRLSKLFKQLKGS